MAQPQRRGGGVFSQSRHKADAQTVLCKQFNLPNALISRRTRLGRRGERRETPLDVGGVAALCDVLACHVLCAMCCVPCAVCLVPCTTCQRALCRVPCAMCRAPRAMCLLPCTTCHMPRALCHAPCAMCCVPCAMRQCPVPCADAVVTAAPTRLHHGRGQASHPGADTTPSVSQPCPAPKRGRGCGKPLPQHPRKLKRQGWERLRSAAVRYGAR